MKKTLFIVLAIMLIALCVVSCKSEPEVYSVTLNLNGGTCATELKQYTQGTAVTLPVPTKADSLFAGWYASSDFSGSAVTAISESDSGNKEFWAKWTIISVTTTFNLNGKYVGGTPSVDGTTNNKKTTSDAFNLPGVVYYSSTDQTKGFAVTKWNTKSDGSGTDYVAGASYTPSTSQTLYIKEGHSWVQLWSGGPKWAEFNIGSTITDYASATGTTDAEKYTTANVGDYYKWGATIARTGAHSTSNSDIQGTANDTAKAIWGDKWKMPKKADLEGLLDTNKCTAEWVETGYGSLKGLKVTGNTTGYTSNSIFLPAAGYYMGVVVSNQGISGHCWSSTHNNTESYNAYTFNFTSSNKDKGNSFRTTSYPVRAILAETN